MSGAKIFSVLDVSQAFWQIKLSKESSIYTTFITPFGKFCFLRLTYGIITASEVYHEITKNIFKIKGVERYIDELIIHAETEEIIQIEIRRQLEDERFSNVNETLLGG